MAGMLLLLVLGTQILDWYWPAGLFVAAFAWGIWQLSRRVPGLYPLAQRIDARMGFHDSLSTAYYFRSAHPAPLVLRQQREAETLAAGAELTQAVPTPAPRSLYALAGLMMAAGALFAMRYLVTHSLDLRAPLAKIEFGSFEPPKPEAKFRKSAVQERFEQQLLQMGMGLDPVDDHPGDQQPPLAPNSFTATPDGRAPIESGEKGAGNSKDGDQTGPEGDDKGEKSAAGAGKDSSAADDLPGLNVNGKQQPSQQQANREKAGQNSKQSSMLDKMRDAMANLMAKLNMKTPGGQQESSNGNSQSGGEQSSQGQKGTGSQSKSKGEGKEQGSPSGEQDSDSGEQAQAASGKSGERNADRAGGQDSKTGMGKQDGNKDVLDAEQLAAMGKISEILGKRSAQMQGEMTVEVPSGKQQLKTAYTRKKAAHGDTGGELSRQEIPLLLQPYIQRYFDEIRKVPAAKTGG